MNVAATTATFRLVLCVCSSIIVGGYALREQQSVLVSGYHAQFEYIGFCKRRPVLYKVSLAK